MKLIEDYYSVPASSIHIVRVYCLSGHYSIHSVLDSTLDPDFNPEELPEGPMLLVSEEGSELNIFASTLEEVEQKMRLWLPHLKNVGHPYTLESEENSSLETAVTIWIDDVGIEKLRNDIELRDILELYLPCIEDA